MVHGGEHLGPRAVVERRAAAAAPPPRALAEHLDVGVAEAVDRLELVADEEHVLRAGPAAQQVDDVALQPVRVLELVDHDARKRSCSASRIARRRAAGHVRAAAGPRSRAPTRAASPPRTRRRTGRAAPAGARCRARRAPRAPPAEPLARASNSAARSPLARQLGGRAAARGRVPSASAVGAAATCRSVAAGSAASAARRRCSSARRSGRRVLAELERQLAPGRAQRLVDARQHPAEPLRAVGREQPQPLRLAAGTERRSARSNASPRITAPAPRRARGSAGRCRPRTGARAGAASRSRGWSRSRRRRARRARSWRPRACSAARIARPQLARGLARVGDDEHRLDVEALVADGAHEPLDEHGRLAGSRAGRDEHLAALPRPQRAAARSRALHPAHRPQVAPRRARSALRVVAHVARRIRCA